MSEMKLTYFNGRGLAETTRLLFALAERSFVDNRIGGEDWAKFKPSTPKGQLPVLEVNGRMICESMAIARFVARETGLYGANNFEAAECDMIGDTVGVVFQALRAKKFQAKTDEERAEAQTKIESAMDSLEKLVLSLKKGTFVLGDKASLADVLVCTISEFCATVDPDFNFEKVPTLKAIKTSFSTIPSVANWMKTRPDTEF